MSEPDFDPEGVKNLIAELVHGKREALRKVEEFRVLLERWLRLRPHSQHGRQVLYEDTERALKK